MDEIECLLFSPHVDDEILGCFSFLDKSCYVICFGAESRVTVSREERLLELERASSSLCFSTMVYNFPVNNYHSPELIDPMEKNINQIKPTTVLIPEPSYNQDHRAVYDAAITATRPHDTNWFVPNVLIYEQPHSLMWSHSNTSEPTFFKEIDIEKKIEAYQHYASQIRGHRSPSVLRAMAQLRGAQICRPYAEAYRVKRILGT